MEENYCEAAVELRNFHKELGFLPGAQVHAVSMMPSSKYPDGDGIIAEYGDVWRDADHMHVPVIFSGNRLGLYQVSRLTLKTKPE